MTRSEDDPILTLEPLVDALRDGIEAAGWELSGLQKTTSHQFEGRWEGESTRSAYLFFHSEVPSVGCSIDVYLDETSRGLTGNIALVVDLKPLGTLGRVEAVLAELAELSSTTLAGGHRRPITLRFRLDDAASDVHDADTEARFKMRIPRAAMDGGHEAVRALSAECVAAFERMLASRSLGLMAEEE